MIKEIIILLKVIYLSNRSFINKGYLIIVKYASFLNNIKTKIISTICIN